MSTLSNIKLKVNIEAFDCYLYSGHLFIFLKDGTISCLNLNKIYHSLYNDNPEYVNFFRLIFQRNDFYKNNQGEIIFGIYELKKEFKSVWEKISKKIEFEYNIDQLEILGKIPENDLPILDVKIYSMKIFIATLKGVYTLQLNSNGKEFSSNNKVKKYFDAKSIYLNAKCGSLAISTNSDGLFFGAIDNDEVLKVNEKEVTAKSLRTSWVHFDLINYESNNSFNYLENRVISQKNKFEYSFSDEKIEKNKITAFGVNKISDKELTANLHFDDEEIKYAFNSSSSAFLITDKGKFYNSNIIVEKPNESNLDEFFGNEEKNNEKEIDVRFSRRYFELPSLKNKKISRPISAHIIDKGCVLEFIDNVVMFKDNDARVIEKNDVINLRTYQNSIRYKNVITIVKSNHITIHSLFPF